MQICMPPSTVERFSIYISYCICCILSIIKLQEPILPFDVDVPQLPIASKQSLNVPLTTVMAEIAEEKSWHDFSLFYSAFHWSQQLSSIATVQAREQNRL